MTYQESLDYLSSLNTFGMRLGLSRIRRLAELLGNPQDSYRTVHITGTNGKGSVSALTAAALSASGRSAGIFTSPHLVLYNERMRVNGTDISNGDFARILTRTRDAAEKMIAGGEESPTQFEVLTAAAFLYFAEQKVDYAVIEVGLGGLLDSTNIITPVACAVTNVTLEHADMCGGTLEGVAEHKAGIIKEGVPVVTAAKGMPLDVIRRTAAQHNAPLYVMDEDFSAECLSKTSAGQRISFSAPAFSLSDWQYELSLAANYQVENSAVAAALLAVLAEKDAGVSMEAARGAFARTTWPGRFERMDVGAQKIVVDGAHNPAGVRALRETLDSAFPKEPRVFLLGILHDKAIEEMLDTLLRPEDTVVVTQPDSARAEVAERLADEVQKRVRNVAAEPDRERALQRALSMAKGAVLCCTGSLYLIGELRAKILEGKETRKHGGDGDGYAERD
ncbi:MAG: bifunctional folylpolyglutamate synthase/dihydrofolate synthase [Schwartzia sp.]|nr:bifunctional folylpolyglutamate synthase/dihydrofolate synthase [Schwartzia sp. (in: firmicutes)]